jgi:hypothetical protein
LLGVHFVLHQYLAWVATMKFEGIYIHALLLLGISAYPGGKLSKTLEDIKIKIHSRGISPNTGPDDSFELIGDLVTPGPTSNVGKLVAGIITGKADGSSDEGDYKAPGVLGSPACAKDTCCTWKFVADELAAKFTGAGGRCNIYARGAIRLGFHDAGTWAKGNPYGGADGSMLLTNEVTRSENAGLSEIVTYLQST